MQIAIDNLGKVAITIEEDYWSDKKDYDKLTVVEKEGIFGTFVSRKPVPAGTPLTDRKYWIPFSSLKEEIVLQFNALVDRVKDLEISVDEKEAEIYKAIASVIVGGVALKQSFGDAEDFGISQKVLTTERDAIHTNMADIQDQINDIILSNSVKLNLNLSYANQNPLEDVIYINNNTDITITATSDAEVDTIQIVRIKKADTTEEEEILAEGSGLSVTVTDRNAILHDSYPYDYIIYTAKFKIGNIVKTVSKIVKGELYIYYGAGTNIDYIRNTISPRTTPTGTYTITNDSNRNYIYFIVPDHMKINGAVLNNFEFPLDAPYTEEIEIGVEMFYYKVYRSSNTYDKGTYTIEIY